MLKRYDIQALAALCSVVLSIWSLFLHPVINHDGVTYLRTAAGLAADTQDVRLYYWPFYSYLIQWAQLLTNVDLLTAARIINILLDALLAFAFVHLVAEAGGDNKTKWWALVIILSLPYLNDNRSEIIRDHGYWAFFTLAAVFYFRMYRQFKLSTLLGWVASLLLATLFRIEGLVFLAMAPLGLLLNDAQGVKQRLKWVATLYLPLLLVAVLWFFMADSLSLFQGRITELQRYFQDFINIFQQDFPHKAALLKQKVLPHVGQDIATFSIYLIPLLMIAKDVITAVTIPYMLILVFRSYFKPRLADDNLTKAWLYLVLLNVVLLLVFVLIRQIMVARYVMPLAFLLLIPVSFALADFFTRAKQSHQAKHKVVYYAILLGVVMLFADGLISTSERKTYIIDAADWVRENLPQESVLASNDDLLKFHFYVNQGYMDEVQYQTVDIRFQTIKNARYLVLPVKRGKPNNQGLEKIKGFTFEKQTEFLNKKGDGYIIYALSG